MNRKTDAGKISIVIPVLNEGDTVNTIISHIKTLSCGHAVEIIVSDGDDTGSTIRKIGDKSVIRLISQRGRGAQMNRGAKAASGDILLFLHADTFLPDNAFREIQSAISEKGAVAGAFDIAFDDNRLWFKVISFTASTRTRLTRIPFGDQAIFISKRYFDEIGGFLEIPLMEDVEIMKRIKKNGKRISIIPLKVKTSARKWRSGGLLCTSFRNSLIQFLYKLGVSPERLVAYYYKR